MTLMSRHTAKKLSYIPKRQSRLRGFSLLEFFIAMAISSVVMSIAVSTTFQFIRKSTQITKKSTLADETKILSDAILTHLQQVGGGKYRPYDVIVSDPDCADIVVAGYQLPDCNQSDRAHYQRFTNIALDISQVQGSVSSPTITVSNRKSDGSNDCIFKGSESDYVGKSIIINQKAGLGGFTSRKVISVNSTHCTISLDSTNLGYSTLDQITSTDYLTGSMNLGYVATLFVDPIDHILKVVKANKRGEVEVQFLAPHVFDIQFKYGFDTTGNSRVDTYYPNINDAVEKTGLRTFRMGIIVGVHDGAFSEASSAKILDGPTRQAPAGWFYKSSVGTISFRNLLYFNN